MNSLKELQANIAAVSTIEGIASVYQGIASLRMNQVKDSVAKTKVFIEGVAEVYHHARNAYIANLRRQFASSAGQDPAKLALLKRNGRTALVFLSSNEHLYGGLILDVFGSFARDIKENKGDAVVIGRFGKVLVESGKLGASIFYFDLDDDKPTPEQIREIIKFLVQYEKVVLHYGQMKTILTQIPARIEITGGVATDANLPKPKDYLFEPTPEAVMEFFETEIIGAIFNQKIFEHQLSRFAARMVAMDQASQNADTVLDKLKKQRNRERRRVQNVKQLDRFAGSSLWGLPAGRKGERP